MRVVSLALASALLFCGQAQANALLEIYHSARQTDPAYQASLAAAQANSENKRQAVAALLPQLSVSAFVQNANRDSQPASGFNPDGSFNINGYSATLTQSIIRFDQFAGLAIGKLQGTPTEIAVVLAEP